MSKAVKKTRVQWARDIRAIHKQTIKQVTEGFHKLGRTLIAAKKALVAQYGHGEFEKMIEADLPFTASTAQRLMKIARDPRLQKSCAAQVFSAFTQYELTKLSDAQFEQAETSGAIHPHMTRGDAVALRRQPGVAFPFGPQPAPDTSEPVQNITAERNDAPPRHVHIVAVNRDAPPPRRFTDLASEAQHMVTAEEAEFRVMPHQIERIVDEMQAQIERGKVVDADIDLCFERIIAKLSGMRRHATGAARLTN
jgi:hypothetical protein